MIRSPRRRRAAALALAGCAAALLYGPGALAAPRVVLLDRETAEYADPEIDVQVPEPARFADVASAVQDFRTRLGRRSATSGARLVTSLDGYEFYSIAGVGTTDAPDREATALLVARGRGTQAQILVEVLVDRGYGSLSPAEFFRSPAGALFRVAVRLAGSGALNRDLYFVWRDGELLEIDALSWLKTLRLEPLGFAPGAGIWKGVSIDPSDFSARTDVWRQGDANCCPSAGSVDVVLQLRGRKLEVRQATPRHAPPSRSTATPG